MNSEITTNWTGNQTEKEKQKHRIREWESQTEVDNGVHPLHWATSLGPSPMGTDPINGFKMVQNGSGISKTST